MDVAFPEMPDHVIQNFVTAIEIAIAERRDDLWRNDPLTMRCFDGNSCSFGMHSECGDRAAFCAVIF